MHLWVGFPFFKFFNIYSFLRERGRERSSLRGGMGRERRAEDPKQAPCWQQWAQCGAPTQEPWDHDLSWSQTLDRLTYPDTPPVEFLIALLRGCTGNGKSHCFLTLSPTQSVLKVFNLCRSIVKICISLIVNRVEHLFNSHLYFLFCWIVCSYPLSFFFSFYWFVGILYILGKLTFLW